MDKITNLKYKNAYLATLLIGNSFIISFVLISFICFFGLTFLYFSWTICLFLVLILLRNTFRRIKMFNVDDKINRRSEIISITITYVFVIAALIYSVLCVKFTMNDKYFELEQKYIFIPIALIVLYIIQFLIMDCYGPNDIRKEVKYIIKNVAKKKDNDNHILDDYEKDYSEEDLELENICNSFIYFTDKGIRFYYNDEIIDYNNVRIKAYYFGKEKIMIQCSKNMYINIFVSKIFLDGKMLKILLDNNDKIRVVNLEKVFAYLCYESARAE